MVSDRPMDRTVVEMDFPDDPVAFFRRHGFSGSKGHIPSSECEGIAHDLWGVHESLLASHRPGAPELVRAMPFPVGALPDELAHRLRLGSLAGLARELLDGQDPHVLSWQAFARRAGTPATPWHRDDVAVPISGAAVAFWIPLAPTPQRTGLVAVTDIDGTGPRPVRQGNLDPGDLTWHDMVVVHQAETLDVDFIAFGIAVVGAQATIELGDVPPLRALRRLLCTSISPSLQDGRSAVTAQTPALASLAG